MRMKYLLAGAVFAAGLMGAAAASADTVIGTEGGSTGFVGNFIESIFPGTHYLVASDGESSFDPFGAGYDTSDGINFNDVGFEWFQAADSHWNFVGGQTWVIPAADPGPGCGAENNNTCEMIGHFISPSAWNPSILGVYLIMDADGSIGDRITAFNTAKGAELTFESDPLKSGAPEASTWAMMLVGFGGLGAMMRRRKLAVAA